ncbi:LacI family DNA-binding transcriptional regulator [Sinomonas mesophila]|uniref:LacI family DNA-binding transcriptional regulator n=1 Tax=Sinomonas mesophila TaxID=1531955 RepID=UPI001FE94BDA|nr:LacI family DNA-binding transcriptional regulator [Sinomonas mesophila]
MTQRHATMQDVARAAGVSHQTVSRVLNGHPYVSEAARTAVEAAIRELGYRRNTAARSLVTRRSQTIGVLGSEVTAFGPSSTLWGVEQAAHEAGYFVSIAGLRDVTASNIADALAHFGDQAVDGIVVVVPHPGTFETLRGLDVGVPLVAVGAHGQPGLAGARVDQEQGAHDAVAHLAGLGHRRIGHVAGPAGWIDAAAREAGWRDALAEAGAPAHQWRREGDWTAADGYRIGLELAEALDGPDAPTAVFVANDQMALGVLRALSERGVNVPGRLSVVGFDDLPEAAFFIPPLTTVRQDFAELGRRALAVLLAEIEGASGPRAEEDGGAGAVDGAADGAGATVPAELVVRETTAPPGG